MKKKKAIHTEFTDQKVESENTIYFRWSDN